MMAKTINFSANKWNDVNLDLTVADVENIIYAMWTATIPLVNPDGNKSYLATFDKIYKQTLQQYPDLDEEGEVIEKDWSVAETVRVEKKRMYPDLDPNDTPWVKVS